MRVFLLLIAGAAAVAGQSLTAPVIFPRGVTDALRRDPAPATVGRGATLLITGFNLGPEKLLTAPEPEPSEPGTPAPDLPVKLGDPEVQVFINGEPAGIYAISAAEILARVPADAPIGVATVSVSVAGVKSEARTFTVANFQPGIATADSSGYGLARGDLGESPVILATTGLGPGNPRAGTVFAYVGGAPARVTTQASRLWPGRFNARIEIPGSARPGDLLNLNTGGRTANLVTLQPLPAPAVQYLALPEGAPDLTGISTPDVDGLYILGTGARETNGCFQAFSFNFAALKADKGNSCLIAAANNAVSPFINSPGSEFVAALVGPSEGSAPAGISKKAAIIQPGKGDHVVDLTGLASSLVGNANGIFVAPIPAVSGGTATVDTITAATGAVRNAAPAPNQGAGNAAPANAGQPAPLEIDGLSRPLINRIGLPGGDGAVLLADSSTAPTKVVFAVVKANGDKVASTAFPSGFVPLLAPAAPPATAPGGGANPAPAANTNTAPPGLAFYLVSQRKVFVAAKKADDSAHAFIAFPIDGAEPAAQSLPEGWFLAACTNNLRSFNIVLTGALAFLGSNSGENTFKASCPASGFITVETESGVINAVSAGQSVDMVAGTSVGAVNDFVWASNLSATTRTSSTLYAFDGANRSVQRLELPAGVNGVQNISAIPALSALAAPATRRAAGDDGLVVFDLDDGTSRHLALPENFGSLTLVGFFPATRKLVARAISTDRRTSNLVVYDLAGKEVTVVANPEGVASVGSRPGAGPAARQLITNTLANTVAAVGYNADGKQVGIVSVRIP